MTEPVAPEPDPILCPECGQTPRIGKKDRWSCSNCFASGRVHRDGYLSVSARYLGMFVGGNAG